MTNSKEKPLKLSKIINRKVGKETYYKFIITIPQREILDKLKWTEETKLKMNVVDKKLVIEKE